jgi:L,D-peptidoglycan transpeptidase YkuD (ErfK/YbiS/YcfS/YnhG family)
MKLRAFSNGLLVAPTFTVRCSIGKGGMKPAAEKTEGDGASPTGVWPIRTVLFRPDRVARPETGVPVEALSPDDGWCDDPADPHYNRAVKLPYPASAERMWRDDHVYDIVVILGHNDAPVEPGKGSAIFFHLARDGYTPTEGCIAVTKTDMDRILGEVKPGWSMEILAA